MTIHNPAPTQYNEQTWQNRYATMGDTAETIFETIAPFGKFERFGFNRLPFRMTHMSEFVRHTPDYVTATGHLIEVMGCGTDLVLKLKVSKYEALKEWNRHNQVVLFLWNSATSEYCTLHWEQVKGQVAAARKRGILAFNDGNEYFGIPWGDLPMVVPYER